MIHPCGRPMKEIPQGEQGCDAEIPIADQVDQVQSTVMPARRSTRRLPTCATALWREIVAMLPFTGK